MKKIASKLFALLPVSWQIRLRKKVSLLYYEAGYGDTLMAGAVAREIKKKYGAVFITVNGMKEELLKNNPNVDRTGQRYDGIDLNYHCNDVKNNTAHSFDDNLIGAMCNKVGIRNPSRSVDIFLTGEENDYAQKQISSLQKPVITIHTTSDSFDNRRKWWPHEYWEKLGDLLLKKGCNLVQLGGEGEQPVRGAIYLAGTTDIRRSIAVIKAADLHIGIVSSLMHGAAAVGTPAVILFGGFERYSLHGYKNITPVESYISCSPCIQPHAVIEQCPFNNKCMREITAEAVYEKVDELLNRA